MLEIFLQNYKKVIMCTSVAICANAIKPVQTEYCRAEFTFNYKSSKKRKRPPLFFFTMNSK